MGRPLADDLLVGPAGLGPSLRDPGDEGGVHLLDGGEEPAGQDVVAATAPEQSAVPAPVAPVDDRVAGLWSSTLGISNVGPDDDFFESGGNSLTAIELMTHVRGMFGIDLGIAAMLDFPTPKMLSDELRRLGAS
ncbi:acyl carrier protein [Streptomyces sp. NPDC088183]|uniref:acyl carrier protein n=1 Tax=Streptomyces sp. NPDC088183 TaxID=3160992 RepID=UPI0034272442